MNVQANNNGGPAGGNRKYPNKYGYEGDLGRGLFDPENFSDVSIDMLHRYNQRHASLLEDDITAGCYTTMTPKEELIEIMKQVDRDASELKPNPFCPKETPLQCKGSHYGALVVDRHTKQRNRYMDDLALQVLKAVMGASDPPEALTKFLRNIEAWVFTDKQQAPIKPPFYRSQKSSLGRSAVQDTAGHRSSDEGPNRSEISQVSQALKPPLEESMMVYCKVVKVFDNPFSRTDNRRRRSKHCISTALIKQSKTKVWAQ